MLSGIPFSRVPYPWLGVVLLVAVLASPVVACGGGGNDTDQIKQRVTTFVAHVDHRDAKAVLNDLPPEQRAKCDQDGMQRELNLRSPEQHLSVANVTVGPIKDNQAPVEIAVKVQVAGQADQTATQTLGVLKRGGS